MKKKGFWIVEIILLALVILTFGNMLAGQAPAQKERVVCVLNDSSAQYRVNIYEGMRLSAQQHDIEFVMADTERMHSASEIQDVISDEALDGFDALIVEQIGTDPSTILPEEVSSGIPRVYLNGNHDTDSENRNVSFRSDWIGQKMLAEIQEDYDSDLTGKTAGIVLPDMESPYLESIARELTSGLQEAGAEKIWEIRLPDQSEEAQSRLRVQKKADIVIACNNESLSETAECAEDGGLHGAQVYGIGNSEENIRYLDSGVLKGMIVPDTFLMGYRAMELAAAMLDHDRNTIQNTNIRGRYFRREDLFSSEANQMYLFPMRQL